VRCRAINSGAFCQKYRLMLEASATSLTVLREICQKAQMAPEHFFLLLVIVSTRYQWLPRRCPGCFRAQFATLSNRIGERLTSHTLWPGQRVQLRGGARATKQKDVPRATPCVKGRLVPERRFPQRCVFSVQGGAGVMYSIACGRRSMCKRSQSALRR